MLYERAPSSTSEAKNGFPLTSASFACALLAALWALWPGTAGNFLFDDYHNLNALKELGGITSLDDLKTFVFSGSAGPTGRPLAMLSFLIEDNAWPSNPTAYKTTNLLIHVLNGSLLAWAGLLLGRLYGLSEKRAQQLAIFNAAIWLLHPLFVSTVFYIVQRMALLAATFCLAGIAGYLHGRLQLTSRPVAAYLWMGSSLALGTLLGVLSKENAALMPLLLLTIEFCAPRQKPRPTRAFRLFTLWLPSLALGGYLISRIDLRPDIWPNRPFDQVQRLLTEPRILWEYLGSLFIPHIEHSGLYRDNLQISTGWLDPPSTFWAILALAILSVAAVLTRRSYALFSVAILFFLAGHLLESSVIGLELYFEHRNYLPAVFLFLPLGQALFKLDRWVSKPLLLIVMLSIVSMMGFMAHQRAHLWGDNDRLKIYWALSNPDSPRAQNALAAFYYNLGNREEAIDVLKRAIKRNPDSALLTMSLLQHRIYGGTATHQDMIDAADALKHQKYSSEALSITQKLVLNLATQDFPRWQLKAAFKLLASYMGNPRYAPVSATRQMVPYLWGRLELAEGRPDEALNSYETAISARPPIKAILLMVAELASTGYPEHALSLLRTASDSGLLNEQDSQFKLQPSYFEDINRIRELLLRDLKEETESNSELGGPAPNFLP